MKNILIVEDHPLFQEVAASIAREAFDDPAIETAASLAEGMRKAKAAHVDLVLLDLGLPDSQGVNTFHRFRRARPELCVVIVCEIEEPSCMLSAIHGGAAGYVLKAMSRPVICAALRLVSAGGTYVPPQIVDGQRVRTPGRNGYLTERQRDVMRLIVQGLPNKEIATTLGIAKDTVKQHARAAYATLGVSSRTQAMTAVVRRGLRLGQ